MSSHNPALTSDRDAFLSSRSGREGRSASDLRPKPRPSPTSFGTMGQPGSFNPDLKSTIISRGITRPETPTFVSLQAQRRDKEQDESEAARRQTEYKDQIDKELKIKVGSENLLEALTSKNAKQTRDQRVRVENELNISNRKIAQLRVDLAAEIERSKIGSPSLVSQMFRNAPARSPSHEDDGDSMDAETESPTFVLADLLQSLEAEGHNSDYYVERANNLADLFKRNPTLKHDLVWSIFGTRMQSMLLSDSREVVASAYRVLRQVITDRKSLSIIRSLQTDYIVILSLVKENKANLEREQALKFVRAFLDVHDGTKEISVGIVRAIAAAAQYEEDRLRSICILTLAEMMIRDPTLVISAGGLSILSEAFAERDYQSSEGLTHAFLYLADTPLGRKHLGVGFELDSPFAAFTDGALLATEEILTANAAVISTLLKSWPGLFALSRNDYANVKSLLASLQMPSALVRDVILELLFDVLRIKSPSWSTPFLAGRRLTTYGRVANLKTDNNMKREEENKGGGDLVDHFTAALLSVLVHSGLLGLLLSTIQDESDGSVKRKATLLVSEVLHLSNKLLPSEWSLDIQILPSLFQSAARMVMDERHTASSAIYQVDSVTRTLQRTGKALPQLQSNSVGPSGARSNRTASDLSKGDFTTQIEESYFRAAITETGVLSTVNYIKWRWDIIQKLIEGPLLNPKRLEEAMKASKFVKRLLGFYRPFKYRFSDILNTKPNQRYVRIGCSLMRTLLANPEGVNYLLENKLLRQVAECLAQVDRMSGITSTSPLFSPERLSDTMSGGYFALLGVVSGSSSGLLMIERWKMINMFYHIIELRGRDDLIRALLAPMDFTLDSQLRIILSKALTFCSLEIRLFATRLLRKYATERTQNAGPVSVTQPAQWAINLLVTQLYDPEMEVCEIAIKILEEACIDEASLEFVVSCRPALDHLGEIGAPLLLRFLSTSTGYHYLDGLDYISQEMDDWFLGRNDSYVTLVEASLAKAATAHQLATHPEQDDVQENIGSGSAPPHFYRELARTAEGCSLLRQKGHFEEFTDVIRSCGLETEDLDTMIKAKGAMWAVGNVGSMELGAPFLDSTEAVQLIINIAEHSEVISIRGTAFFVLGLISRSIHGQEILAEHGWDSTIDDFGHAKGVCLPSNLRKLFTLPKPQQAARRESGPANLLESESAKAVLADEDPTNAQILALVNDIMNSVLTKGRANELHALRARKAPGFAQPELFHKVMKVLERHHYRLPVMRFVIDLFDKSVLRKVVLEDSESDEEGDETVVPIGVAE